MPRSSIFSCTICCEDVPTNAMCLLSICSHEVCSKCMKKVIQASIGSFCQPACPFCRTTLVREDISAIHRREGPTENTSASTPPPQEDAIDDHTQSWLQEHTRPCPSCSTRIERTNEHSEMRCWCGCTFCYTCGSQEGHCQCYDSQRTSRRRRRRQRRERRHQPSNGRAVAENLFALARQRLAAEAALTEQQADIVELERLQTEIELEEDNMALQQRERIMREEQARVQESVASIIGFSEAVRMSGAAAF